MQSSPSFQHQTAVTSFGSHFRGWSHDKPCEALVAPFDVLLEAFDKTNVVQPDVVVICDLENVNEKGRYSDIPTVVVEVLSESTRSYDMVKKLEVYRAGGVQDYGVYRQDSHVQTSALVGLILPVSQIFA